jgi:hypothetical protein
MRSTLLERQTLFERKGERRPAGANLPEFPPISPTG